MKTKILLLLFIAAVFTGCSTAYRTTQTPDDVYFSPARLQDNNVRRNDDERINNSDVYISSEDRELRRRVHNRRLRMYDDWYYCGYDTYGYPVYVPKSNIPSNNQPRKFNLGVYNGPDTKTNNTGKTGMNSNTNNNNVPVRNFNNSSSNTNNGTGVGNFLRKVFNDGNSSSNNSNNNSNVPVRTFDRSSNTNTNTNNSSGNSNNSSSGNNSNTNTNNAPVRR